MPSRLLRIAAPALLFALVFFVCLHAFAAAQDAFLVVTTVADSGTGSLRAALLEANLSPSTDTISFAVTGTIALDSPLPAVAGDLVLRGPGAANLAIDGSYLYRLLDVQPNVALTLTNLMLTHGRAPNGETGGAIRSRGRLAIVHSDLRDNLSVDSGAAIAVIEGTLYVEGSHVQGNQAQQNGGIAIADSSAAISGSVLAGNQGSAIAADEGSTVYITATEVISNSGRGIEADRSDVFLSAVAVGANGDGGISVYAGTLAVANSKITGNRSDQGAGIYVSFATTTLTDTLLAGNQASREGGAIFQSALGKTVTIDGGALVNNMADWGGGIHLNGGDLQVRGARLLANQAVHGAAIYLSSMQEAHVADSCIAHNYSTARDGAVVELARYNPYYLSAPDNWWGSAGGPSGAGPGSGDSVGDHVIFTKYKTAPPEGCPSGPAASVYLPLVQR